MLRGAHAPEGGSRGDSHGSPERSSGHDVSRVVRTEVYPRIGDGPRERQEEGSCLGHLASGSDREGKGRGRMPRRKRRGAWLVAESAAGSGPVAADGQLQRTIHDRGGECHCQNTVSRRTSAAVSPKERPRCGKSQPQHGMISRAADPDQELVDRARLRLRPAMRQPALHSSPSTRDLADDSVMPHAACRPPHGRVSRQSHVLRD